ncbi:MAG: CHAT domain-containing protein [Proteobacteria bacterium]|nr:CHAT domain-containing protein [Pseudomonadota bacterium]
MHIARALVALSLALALPAAGWAQASGREDGDRATRRMAALSPNLRGDEVVRRPAPAIVLSQNKLRRTQMEEAKQLGKRAKKFIKDGRYAEAESLIKRALATKERWLGAEHFAVAESLNDLAGLYRIQGRYAVAEPLLKRSLAIKESKFGTEHRRVAKTLDTLAQLYRAQGRYAEAEPLVKRALAIWERTRGQDHPTVATSLGSLALLYRAQGRNAEAIPLIERALAIFEEAKGADNPQVAKALNNLAAAYRIQNRAAEAEPLLKRALAIWEKAKGPDHMWVGKTLNNIANLYKAQGRAAEAEPLVERSLGIFERAFGPNHPEVARTLSTLAGLYRDQGRYAEAEPHLERALAINERVLGADHPRLAKTLSSLAKIYKKQRRHAEALDYIRRASNIHRARAARSGGRRSVGGLAEQKNVRGVFVSHANYLAGAIERGPERRAPLLAESFDVGQLAQATSAAAAVAGMAARFAAGDDDLARTVRARQDAVERWRILDTRLVEAVAAAPDERDAAAEARTRSGLTTLEQRIDELGARLTEEFPEYAELASPKPIALAEIQDLLGPSEALMTYLVWDERTFLWVVRRDDAAFHRLDIGRQEIEDAVTVVRDGLDQPGVGSLGDIRRFDVEEALALYRRIFAPAEPMLDGARHVFVVPDAALQSLPLGVLVTEAPKRRVRRFAAYRDVPWLAKRYALTTLPAVSSLRALRRFAKAASAKRPFVGFGDPKFGNAPGKTRGADAAVLFTRGAVADVDSVRNLPRLPDTADEVIALAKALGVDESTVYLQDRATEARVRSMDLSEYRVLAFATHGLVSGELEGVAEPALALTPPEVGTAEDDGLLTASEIATLDLDADWVILSACNTAAADGTPGAEGLSGLAKAFFYAGARALLVSHWSVSSEAAVALTTRMLGELADHPEIGRAEALKRSMLAMMANEEKDHFAHPMFWAPFVVVGEGGVPGGA